MKIIMYPNEILRNKTEDMSAEKIQSKQLTHLIEKMIKTMYKADGVGLAANQVGMPIRLCVIKKECSPRYAGESTRLFDDRVLINPYIIERSSDADVMEEGCLSLPDKNYYVMRSKSVKVKALSEKGEPLLFHAHGFFARVIQHEVDHLDGILIIDRKYSAKREFFQT